MPEDRKDIFVVGLDDFNLELLKQVPHAEELRFHALLDHEELISTTTAVDANALLDQARKTLDDHGGQPDAIVCYWDFPAVVLTPILQREYGLPGPSIEAVLRCEHKYWSRIEQKKAIPEHVPRFELLDPFADSPEQGLELDFPFWLKPITAHSSILGFRIEDRDQLRECLDETRSKIGCFAGPLADLMTYADVPEEVAARGGAMCIAEEMIDADMQCTVEGYARNGRVRAYGIVDSIRGKGPSFERYEYPSEVDPEVREEMIALTTRVIEAIELDDSAFNIEYFYDPDSGRLSLLEINARISQSHSPLFWKIDGSPHKEIMIDLALGRTPRFRAGRGPYNKAAKFMPRVYGQHEGQVFTDAPSEDEVERIAEHYPGAEIKVEARPGMDVTDLPKCDSYSCEVATLFMGARSHDELMRNYRDCIEDLHIEVSS